MSLLAILALPWQVIIPYACLSLFLVLLLIRWRMSGLPRLYWHDSGPRKSLFFRRLLDHIPLLQLPFKPCLLLPHNLLQAYFANFLRRDLGLAYEREIVRLPDGEVVALDWHMDEWMKAPDDPHAPLPFVPTAVILHGIAGGSHEINVQILSRTLVSAGARVVVYNRRGCALGLPLRNSRPYQYGDTADLQVVLDHIQEVYPNSPLVGVGLSAGSNPLVKYLGETGEESRFIAGMSVCNAFDLDQCSRLLQKRPFLDALMAQSLKNSLFERHVEQFVAMPGLHIGDIRQAKSVREFDGAFTCRLYGYKDVTAYHRFNSSIKYLPHVRVPLLCVNALDDPIVDKSLIPYEQVRKNPMIMLVTTKAGGHLGWLEGWFIARNRPSWIERLATEFVLHVADDPDVIPQSYASSHLMHGAFVRAEEEAPKQAAAAIAPEGMRLRKPHRFYNAAVDQHSPIAYSVAPQHDPEGLSLAPPSQVYSVRSESDVTEGEEEEGDSSDAAPLARPKFKRRPSRDAPIEQHLPELQTHLQSIVESTDEEALEQIRTPYFAHFVATQLEQLAVQRQQELGASSSSSSSSSSSAALTPSKRKTPSKRNDEDGDEPMDDSSDASSEPVRPQKRTRKTPARRAKAKRRSSKSPAGKRRLRTRKKT